jgi:hypothetical protein
MKMWNHKVEDWVHLELKQNYQNQIDYLAIDYFVAIFLLVDSSIVNVESVQKHEDLYSLHVYMHVPSSYRIKNK